MYAFKVRISEADSFTPNNFETVIVAAPDGVTAGMAGLDSVVLSLQDEPDSRDNYTFEDFIVSGVEYLGQFTAVADNVQVQREVRPDQDRTVAEGGSDENLARSLTQEQVDSLAELAEDDEPYVIGPPAGEKMNFRPGQWMFLDDSLVVNEGKNIDVPVTVLRFDNPVFNTGLNVTVRKAAAKYANLQEGEAVRLANVDGSEVLGLGRVFCSKTYPTALDVPAIWLKDEHDPACRDTAGLWGVLKEVYGDDISIDDPVTVIAFYVEELGA